MFFYDDFAYRLHSRRLHTPARILLNRTPFATLLGRLLVFIEVYVVILFFGCFVPPLFHYYY